MYVFHSSLTMPKILFFCVFVHNSFASSPPLFVHEPNSDKVYFEQVSYLPIEDSMVGRRFQCKAEGHPSIRYQWLRNNSAFNLDDPLLSDRISRVPGEGSFIIRQPKAADEGIYQCVAVNDAGTTMDKPIHFIRAYIKLFSTVSPRVYNVKFGYPFSKVCEAPDSAPPARVYWILMNDHLEKKPRMFLTVNSSNVVVNDKGQIFFQYMRDENNIPGFYYTCVAENLLLKEYQFGEQFRFNIMKNRQSVLSEILPREQYYSDSDMVVLKGEILELFCVVAGYPDKIPRWEKVNGTVDYGRVSWTTNFKKSIRIEKVKLSDEGTYSCRFEDSPQFDREFRVSVEAAPYWNEELSENSNLSYGNNFEHFCDVRGRPELEFKFFMNGQELRVDEHHKVDGPRLTIKNGDQSPGGPAKGVYQCQATNRHGFYWHTFT